MPRAGAIPDRALAFRTTGELHSGRAARRVLRRMLLDVDGATICRRRDESDLDCRIDGGRTLGEAVAGRRKNRKILWRSIALVGRRDIACVATLTPNVQRSSEARQLHAEAQRPSRTRIV